MSKLATPVSVTLPPLTGGPETELKMKKLTPEEQGIFMIVAETVHPNLRLGFPSSARVLASISAYIVNSMMKARSIEEGINSLFENSQEMRTHVFHNVTAVLAKEYPGRLADFVKFIPVADALTRHQCTAIVEYVFTELLTFAGHIAELKKDQPQYQIENKTSYEDFPQIRPCDMREAVESDDELRGLLGGLFKIGV
jgi:hypothetical protein